MGDEAGIGEQPKVGLLEVLEENAAIHHVVHVAGGAGGGGDLIVLRQPLLDLGEGHRDKALTMTELCQM